MTASDRSPRRQAPQPPAERPTAQIVAWIEAAIHALRPFCEISHRLGDLPSNRIVTLRGNARHSAGEYHGAADARTALQLALADLRANERHARRKSPATKEQGK